MPPPAPEWAKKTTTSLVFVSTVVYAGVLMFVTVVYGSYFSPERLQAVILATVIGCFLLFAVFEVIKVLVIAVMALLAVDARAERQKREARMRR